MAGLSGSSEVKRGARGQRGFSYFWVLFAVALVGLGLTIAADVETTLRKREREQALLSIGRQFRHAFASYQRFQRAEGKREYPASLEELLRDPRAPGTLRHLRKVFVDPVTGKAEWGEVRLGGRLVGLHSLSAARPIKEDGFEPDDAAFKGREKYSEWVFTYPPDLLLNPPGSAASAPVELPAGLGR